VGTHRLLDDGARPVTDLDAWSSSLRLGDFVGLRSRPAAPDLDDPATRRVWSVLEDEGRPLDALLAEAGLPADRLLATLSRLELEGWVRRLPGPGYSRRVA
jgi:predicted Rossmann fold nucleotide-binding protein DprA/Smf involved in DNA uptake